MEVEKKTKFLDPEVLLKQVGLNNGQTVVDLGAGSGFFSLAAAKIVGKSGKVYVVDVQEKALEHVASMTRLKNYSNLQTIRANLESNTLEKIPDGTADLVVCVNIIHQIKNQNNLIQTIFRILKTSGQLLVVDWSGSHPIIGPKNAPLLSADELKKLFAKAHLKYESEVPVGIYHFGLTFIK